MKNMLRSLVSIAVLTLNLQAAYTPPYKESDFYKVFTVTTNTDTPGKLVKGELRSAILASNLTYKKLSEKNSLGKKSCLIKFNIPSELANQDGTFTIAPTKPMPYITQPVYIDGFSQRDAQQNTATIGNNAVYKIILSGEKCTYDSSTEAANGLLLYYVNKSNNIDADPSGTTITGLVINNWNNYGIQFLPGINGSGSVTDRIKNVTIMGNFIGLDATGAVQQPNQSAIWARGTDNLVIGGATPASRNAISGNYFAFDGYGCVTTNNCTNTTIQNNYIGTNASGTEALGNSLIGLDCINCTTGFLIGGDASTGNLISGHLMVGLLMESVSTGTVSHNFFGTDISGTKALNAAPNTPGNIGILLDRNTQHNVIKNNLISGHNSGIQAGLDNVAGDYHNNLITDNYIGVDTSGLQAIPNNYGVQINSGSNTLNNNVIAGNSKVGVLVYGKNLTSDVPVIIQSNNIGLGADDTTVITNGVGIQLGIEGAKIPSPGTNITIEDNSFGTGNTVIVDLGSDDTVTVATT